MVPQKYPPYFNGKGTETPGILKVINPFGGEIAGTTLLAGHIECEIIISVKEEA